MLDCHGGKTCGAHVLAKYLRCQREFRAENQASRKLHGLEQWVGAISMAPGSTTMAVAVQDVRGSTVSSKLLLQKMSIRAGTLASVTKLTSPWWMRGEAGALQSLACWMSHDRGIALLQ